MDIEGSKHFLRTFEDLLYDSVYLLYSAIDTNEEDFKDNIVSTYIRSSVINSILTLECASNCLIDALQLQKKFYQDIEKLPFISKFEYFLHVIRPSALFDRGCKEVQSIIELKSIRDLYVHPKVKSTRFEKVSHYAYNADYGKTNILSIPREPQMWTIETAKTVLKAVNEFFNIYFLKWCNLNHDQVIDLLMSYDEVDLNQPIGAAIDCIGGLNRAMNEWQINFAYIGKTKAT